MAPGFIEVSLRSNIDAGELLAMIPGDERIGCWEDDGVIRLYWPEQQWAPELLEEVRRVMGLLQIDAQASGLTVRHLPDRDWNTAWAASLTPITLGRHVRIRQSWHPRDTAFNGIELVIDPKRAFGTGHHATTRMIVEWLEDEIRGGERVLDVGTGSGILAMAAIRLGARAALAIDNDPVAVECAKECAAANGFGGELEFRVSSFEDCRDGVFDIIVANIDGTTLPLLCPLLPGMLADEAKGCFSGLQQQDYEQIVAALGDAGLSIKKQAVREEWIALSFGRS